MKQNGYKQITVACYVVFLCCCLTSLGQAWKLEVTEEDPTLQNHNPLVLQTRSRRETLQLLNLLQRLKQHQDLGQDLQDESALEEEPNNNYSNLISNRLPEHSDQWMPTAKRQRPCFWSVVTCY
uniref:Somatostatin/Cortistatin C-terminal domain-containing protein n=1 Tax=Arion vulgaris TaxID=1028688 RepID=A0A0B6YZS1_9EUPU